ncbi:quinoprotein relay system zinc metallohydrolase 1 [Sphingomonas sp. AP4-R1]|uniref:quinoprotein relay system zinc metallohydrolase 1 n=1 Tax=Sphingomonas sp. AP4-R1 TaxID=2735134 RepID=UPI0014938BD4|nr:quinoprotein relay system zinc metallohydrolase 1 [Sphingomonas sp. AP4-R1]QJU60109.1 quinoprotein relay system zinc metallohydrolase 1 [Sphingomonas sp. AP4-R1]
MTPSRRTILAGLIAAPLAAALPAYRIVPERIGDGIWMIHGADAPIEMGNGGAIANITILATDAGAVLIDCGPSLRYGQALTQVAATLTGKPVTRVYLTHLHPDHIYGAAAFDPAIVAATPALAASLRTEGQGFADGMYRLLGDWMRGTEFRMPGVVLSGESETIGGRTFGLLPLAGHSGADLAILDRATGTLIAGDLVFHDRAPSTPHADVPMWLASLARLKAIDHRTTVPGHGPFDPGPASAIDQTRDWLEWLTGALRAAVLAGMDMVAAGAMPIPDRFARMAAARYELERSVSHLYPAIEAELLPRIDGRG